MAWWMRVGNMEWVIGRGKIRHGTTLSFKKYLFANCLCFGHEMTVPWYEVGIPKPRTSLGLYPTQVPYKVEGLFFQLEVSRLI